MLAEMFEWLETEPDFIYQAVTGDKSWVIIILGENQRKAKEIR
jgi:hypothetical protein